MEEQSSTSSSTSTVVLVDMGDTSFHPDSSFLESSFLESEVNVKAKAASSQMHRSKVVIVEHCLAQLFCRCLVRTYFSSTTCIQFTVN